LAAASDDLKDCLRWQFLPHWENISKFIFKDVASLSEQSGLFKLEGIWTNCLFRSGKAYYLENRLGDLETETALARMRSIPRKRQHLLGPAKFGQDPRDNMCTVRATEMKPTLGLEVVMLQQGRTLSHGLNLKRKMIVSSKIYLSLHAPQMHKHAVHPLLGAVESPGS
jgi:hypothetical protein